MLAFMHRVQDHLVIGLDRVYFFNYLILILTSIGYFAYLYVSGTQNGGVNLQDILKGSPYSAIMMLVVLMNLLVGYYMWQKKDKILSSRTNARWGLLPLAACQFALGNILNGTLSILTYFSLNERGENLSKSHKVTPGLKSFAISTSVYYLFCLGLIVLIMIH